MKLLTDNIPIKVKYADKFFSRFRGLMFKKNIDYVLVFPKCNSIHTFFMLEPIDVIMTDINNNILYKFEHVLPWRVILPKKGVYYTYEFPINYKKL